MSKLLPVNSFSQKLPSKSGISRHLEGSSDVTISGIYLHNVIVHKLSSISDRCRSFVSIRACGYKKVKN